MLAVTTRNKLKSPRFLLPMTLARRRVREQLRHTRGLVRWADAIASPTEFYTLTVWANKATMFNFMSSDAHREMMWQFAHWSDEFWSMRWVPTEHEIGAWNGAHLARADPKARRRPQIPMPEISRPPHPGAGSVDPSTCPVTAVTAHLKARDVRAIAQLVKTWRYLRQGSADSPPLLRWAMGSVSPDQFLLVTLWKDYDHDVMSRLARDLPGAWLMEWQPGDYEIGHWAGMRLRQFAERRLQKAVGEAQHEKFPMRDGDGVKSAGQTTATRTASVIPQSEIAGRLNFKD